MNKTSKKRSNKNNNRKENDTNHENERQEIEKQIILYEEKIKEMEGLFDKTTLPEKYREYDELLKKVETLYSKWHDLIAP